MKTFETHAAQGDIFIRRVAAIPKNAKPAKPDGGKWIIAHSETGHHHVIDRPKAEVYEAVDDHFVAWIRMLKDGELRHERSFDTHESLKLEAGAIYEVRRQREYTPEGFRRAAD